MGTKEAMVTSSGDEEENAREEMKTKLSELEDCINILKDKVEELEAHRSSSINYLNRPPERK